MMMKVLVTTLTFLLLSACNPPQQERFIDYSFDGQQGSGFNNFTSGSGTSTNTDNFVPNPNTDPTNLGPGFEFCDLGYRYSINQLGYFGICRHNSAENMYKFQFNQTPAMPGVCFVPMHRNADGSSFKVGMAECVQSVYIQPNNVLNLVFRSKELPDTINAVMVVYSNSLTPFMDCQNGKAQFYQANGCSCDIYGQCNKPVCYQADSYAQQICETFVSNHAGYYRQVNF
jgi:hypothetical protein